MASPLPQYADLDRGSITDVALLGDAGSDRTSHREAGSRSATPTRAE